MNLPLFFYLKYKYLNPNSLYIVLALGKSNITVNIKLYISSIKKILHNVMLSANKWLIFLVFDNLISAGNMTYIKRSPDIPNINTLLKHTYPPILPKLNIS